MSVTLDTLRARYRRQRRLLLLAATAALAGVPRQVAQLLLGAGLPGPLELTPR